ncbi:NADPH-dependent FMN reductase [Nocardia sp. NPDC059177]|uniref:NADPH-dependent FMN reductase n=1 Tax=Nocardia sp. NPDC059177 TaxID=3346759 RepID=UPI0036A6EC4A
MNRILLISGSTRDGSTNTAALRTVAAFAPADVRADLYDGLRELPAFVPGEDPDDYPAVAALRAELAAADAVLFCTPEYAGTLPGSMKNLLDWTVGTGDLYGKPIAWLTVAVPGRGEGAVATLSTVLGYVGAEVVERACARLPVLGAEVDADGLVGDPEFRARASAVLAALSDHLAARLEA